MVFHNVDLYYVGFLCTCHISEGLPFCCNMWLIFKQKTYGERVVRFRGIFEILFLRVSINTLLYNPNLVHSESHFPCSRGRRKFSKPH